MQQKGLGKIGKEKCLVEGCERLSYAKGYCRKHHTLFLRRGEIKYSNSYGRKCVVDSCQEEATPRTNYCKFHSERKRNGTPLDLPLGTTLRGERNPRWNGGTSHYPNHYLMKKVRLEVLKEANYICWNCGKPADRIHHLDKSTDNHSKENLRASCAKCNMKFQKPHQSKFKKLYGKTFLELRKEGFFRKNPSLFPYKYEVVQRLEIGL